MGKTRFEIEENLELLMAKINIQWDSEEEKTLLDNFMGSVSDLETAHDRLTNPKLASEVTPTSYGKGDWDGLVSDLVLVILDTGEKSLGKVYEGFIDGVSFCNWCDQNDMDFGDRKVKYWLPLGN